MADRAISIPEVRQFGTQAFHDMPMAESTGRVGRLEVHGDVDRVLQYR